jgi:hypothetical protein
MERANVCCAPSHMATCLVGLDRTLEESLQLKVCKGHIDCNFSDEGTSFFAGQKVYVKAFIKTQKLDQLKAYRCLH